MSLAAAKATDEKKAAARRALDEYRELQLSHKSEAIQRKSTKAPCFRD